MSHPAVCITSSITSPITGMKPKGKTSVSVLPTLLISPHIPNGGFGHPETILKEISPERFRLFGIVSSLAVNG